MLRRFFILVTVVVLGAAALSGLNAAPTQAQDAPPDLTALTEYFPDDTIVYAASRIDGDFIDELDALWEKVMSKLPPGTVPSMGLKQALDMAVQEGYGQRATFANTFAPWLGDTAAIGVGSLDVLFDSDYSNDNEVPVVGAISITDKDKAEAFLDDVTERANMDKKDMGADGILYAYDPSQTYSSGAILLLDDVMLIAPSANTITGLNRLEKTLGDNATFSDTLAKLPEENYNIVAFLDIGPTLANMYEQMFAQMGSMMMPDGMSGMMDMAITMYRNYPPMAMGFTLLDGRSLTMDYAIGSFDISAIEEAMGLDSMTIPAPVSLDFAQYIPADAPIVIHGTGVGENTKRSLQVMAYMVDAFKEMAFMFSDMGGSGMDDIPQFVRDITGNDVRAFINLSFAGMTGLNLEKDVLDHINGNSAFYLRFLLSDVLGYTLDGAVIIENAEPDAMQKIFDGLLGALEQYDANFEREGDAVSLPGLISGFFPAGMPEEMMAAPELDFLFGLNDNLFAFGTRKAVEFSLDPSGDSLADDPAFTEASQYFLDNTVMVWYLGFAPIAEALDVVAGSSTVDSYTARDLETVSTALGIFDSASITASLNDDYSGVARFVLTLAE